MPEVGSPGKPIQNQETLNAPAEQPERFARMELMCRSQSPLAVIRGGRAAGIGLSARGR